MDLPSLLAQVEEQSIWLNIVLPLIPWIIVFGAIWILVFRGLRSERARVRQSNERAHAHWDAVEAKLDRIIQLLEQRQRGE
jgi:hypothetical protein